MKPFLLFLVAALICMPILLLGNEESNRLVGYWLTGDKTTKIEIFQNGDSTFAGKIIWLKEPNDSQGKPKKDVNNPNEKLRDRPLLNMVILTDLILESHTKYKNGKLYEPETGKTYSAKVELVNNNTITIRYFIGVPTLGRTDTWIRTTK
ncbi:MAG: DUF2147 domain-containing protein [Candidatus Cloacimonas sp.]